MERDFGQRNLYVIGAYKEKVIELLKENVDLQLALTGKCIGKDTTVKERAEIKKAVDNCIYDYAFVPNTITDERIYICVEIVCPYATAGSWKELYTYVYVFTPKNVVNWGESEIADKLINKGYIGNKIDVVTDMVDRTLKGRTDFGLGKIEMAPRDGMQIFSYVDGYYGKQLTYKSTEFNIDIPAILHEEYKNGKLDE